MRYETKSGALNQIAVNLRRYTLESKLEIIRKIAIFLDPMCNNKEIEKQIFSDGVLPNNWYPDGPYFLFELEYLSLVSTIAGEWQGYCENLSSRKEYRKIVNLYRSYKPPFIRDDGLSSLEENEEIINLFFLRLSHQQFKYQYHPLSGISRHNYFFSYSNSKLNIFDAFIDIFEYPYEDYVIFAYAYQTICSLTQEIIDIDLVVNNFIKGKLFSRDKVIGMLNKLSMDRETAINAYNKYRNADDSLRIYDYNPYSLRPILQHDDKLFTPIPRLLVNAITEGFLSRIFVEKGNDFRRAFGEYTFFDYLNMILNEDKGIDEIIPEFVFYIGKQEYKSPDFILVKSEDIIILEAKATTPAVSLKTASMCEYLNQLEKAYAKAILQCIKKEQQIHKKYIVHDKLPEKIGRVYYLVVTLEDFRFPVNKFLRNKIVEYCQSEGYCFSNDILFHAMSVQTLESIIEKDRRDLFSFLEEREVSKTVFETYPETSIENNIEIKDQKDFILWDSFIRKLTLDLFNKDI